jgi:hypothetical protein
MKKNYFLALLVQILAITGFGQISVNQIIVGNGGIYGNSSDHVTLTGINPDDLSATTLGEVWRESIQDVVVVGDIAFVAAEDSLVKFNLSTHEKMAAMYHGNLSRLCFANEKLYVSLRSDLNGPPADGCYLKAFDSNLNLIHQTTGISTDASCIVVAGDSIYVAVPGDWMSTEGHLAIVSTDFSVTHEINLGEEAVGINDLYLINQVVFSVNKSPYLATTGSVSNYHLETGNFSTHVFNHVVGKGAGRIGDLIYLGLDYGLGSYNTASQSIENETIIPDPGSANYIYMAASLVDEINSRIYITTTDYFSFGQGWVYDLEGNNLGNFSAGVSAEAMALHLTDETGTQQIPSNQLSLFPNPSHDFFSIDCNERVKKIEIYTKTGQLVKTIAGNPGQIYSCASLMPGSYVLRIYSDKLLFTSKLVKI